MVAILDDLLAFAVYSVVDGGRLCFWMPTANDEDQELPVPFHPCLELVNSCKQVFTKCTYHLFRVCCVVLTTIFRQGQDD